MKTTLADFGVSLSELKDDLRNDKEIEQNHFGDFLMIQEEKDNERYKVWLNHHENVIQGESVWQIEYSGKKNNWVWETVGEGNE